MKKINNYHVARSVKRMSKFKTKNHIFNVTSTVIRNFEID